MSFRDPKETVLAAAEDLITKGVVTPVLAVPNSKPEEQRSCCAAD